MSIPPSGTNADAAKRQTRTGERLAGRLIAVMSHSTNRIGRLAAHPIGAAQCLALGYMILCGAYIAFSGRLTARVAGSVEQLREFELLKGIAFVVVTGLAYFYFAAFLLKRISAQQQHLALIFEGVSDPLFLLQVEGTDRYRFLCVNAAFLTMTGLSREQVAGRRLDDVLPALSQTQALAKCRDALRDHKTVRWEADAAYPAGRREGEVTLTPLADNSGEFVQLAGVIHDITERRQAEDEIRQLSSDLRRSQDEERLRRGAGH